MPDTHGFSLDETSSLRTRKIARDFVQGVLAGQVPDPPQPPAMRKGDIKTKTKTKAKRKNRNTCAYILGLTTTGVICCGVALALTWGGASRQWQGRRDHILHHGNDAGPIKPYQSLLLSKQLSFATSQVRSTILAAQQHIPRQLRPSIDDPISRYHKLSEEGIQGLQALEDQLNGQLALRSSWSAISPDVYRREILRTLKELDKSCQSTITLTQLWTTCTTDLDLAFTKVSEQITSESDNFIRKGGAHLIMNYINRAQASRRIQAIDERPRVVMMLANAVPSLHLLDGQLSSVISKLEMVRLTTGHCIDYISTLSGNDLDRGEALEPYSSVSTFVRERYIRLATNIAQL